MKCIDNINQQNHYYNKIINPNIYFILIKNMKKEENIIEYLTNWNMKFLILYSFS